MIEKNTWLVLILRHRADCHAAAVVAVNQSRSNPFTDGATVIRCYGTAKPTDKPPRCTVLTTTRLSGRGGMRDVGGAVLFGCRQP
jgi:hypothetical protein